MLKLSDSFALQSNQVKFGSKYESQQVTTSLYSNGIIKIESKTQNFEICCNTILSVCFFQTKKSNDTPGFEIYMPMKTYLFANQSQEIVNKWYYTISRMVDPSVAHINKELCMNIIRRKGYGITDDWEPATLVADCCKIIIYSDSDCAEFRYEHAYTTFDKIVFKKDVQAHPNQLTIERNGGREIVFSHPSYAKMKELLDFFRGFGLDSIITTE